MKKEIIHIDDNGNCRIIDINRLSVEHRGQYELYYYDNKPLVGFGEFKSNSYREGDSYKFKVSRDIIPGDEFKKVPYPASND